MAARAGLASPVAWWLVIAHGECSACLGLLLLAQTGADNLLALLALLGVYWLLGGLLEVASLGGDRSGRVWNVLSGAVQAGAAAAVLRHPLWSTVLVPGTLVTTVGGLGLAIGAVQLLRALAGGGRGAIGLAAMSLPLGGILLLCPPRAAAWATGLWALAAGSAALLDGLRLRRPAPAPGRASYPAR